MTVEDTIRQKLTEAFTPERLDVRNDSHLHSGHAGSPGTGDQVIFMSLSSRPGSRGFPASSATGW